MRAKSHKELLSQQLLKRRLEHSFRIVKQLPFTNKSVGSGYGFGQKFEISSVFCF